MIGRAFVTTAALAIGIGTGSGAVLAEDQAAAETKPAVSQTAAAEQSQPAGSASGQGHSDLAKQATDPSAILTQLQLQNIFVPSSHDADGINASGYANTFIIQPVIPIAHSESFPLDLVVRPTLPIVTTPDFDLDLPGPDFRLADSVTEVGGLSVIAPFFKREEWGTWGAGPALTFPTSTDRLTGASKWQAGPVAAVINRKSVENWTLGVLGWNQWSYASARDDAPGVNKLFLQAVAVRHFEDGYYAGWGELPFTFDWKRDGKADIPLNVRAGKVLKLGNQPMNAFVEPFYTVSHGGVAPPTGASRSTSRSCSPS